MAALTFTPVNHEDCITFVPSLSRSLITTKQVTNYKIYLEIQTFTQTFVTKGQ